MSTKEVLEASCHIRFLYSMHLIHTLACAKYKSVQSGSLKQLRIGSKGIAFSNKESNSQYKLPGPIKKQ